MQNTTERKSESRDRTTSLSTTLRDDILGRAPSRMWRKAMVDRSTVTIISKRPCSVVTSTKKALIETVTRRRRGRKRREKEK